jgi:hypothetical protein
LLLLLCLQLGCCSRCRYSCCLLLQLLLRCLRLLLLLLLCLRLLLLLLC